MLNILRVIAGRILSIWIKHKQVWNEDMLSYFLNENPLQNKSQN